MAPASACPGVAPMPTFGRLDSGFGCGQFPLCLFDAAKGVGKLDLSIVPLRPGLPLSPESSLSPFCWSPLMLGLGLCERGVPCIVA